MSLYDETIVASQLVETYRDPDVSQWITMIDPVLEAAGECIIGVHGIESISLTTAGVHITTSFSSRSCPMSSEMYLPRRILEAADPIKAANVYRVNNRILEVEDELAYARDRIIRYEAKLAELIVELNSFENSL